MRRNLKTSKVEGATQVNLMGYGNDFDLSNKGNILIFRLSILWSE